MKLNVSLLPTEPFEHRPYSPARAWAVSQGLARLALWLGITDVSLRNAMGRGELSEFVAEGLARASAGLFSADDFRTRPQKVVAKRKLRK